MMIQNLAKYSALFVFLLLQACSSIQKQENQAQESFHWPEIQQSLQMLDRWSLIGKISIRTESDSFTAAINKWQQQKSTYAIDLSSTFFGMGATRMLGDSGFLTILEAGEPPLSSDQPNELIYQALGVPLPISHLADWVKGTTTTSSPYDIKFNQAGLPETISQSGWKIQYSKHKLKDGVPLPHKIKLTQANTKIILAVKKWTLLSQ